MKRTILAVIAGLATWIVVVSLLDRVLRVSIDGYLAAEPTFAFTLPMMLARLGIGALSSLAAGAVAAAIQRTAGRAPWIAGVVLLAMFVPMHVKLWNVLPLWYHLVFLSTLVPLFGAGALLVRRRSTAPAAPTRSAAPGTSAP